MLNHIKRPKLVGCSLVSNLKEVKARLYGKDGYGIEKPVSQGIKGKVPQGQSQEREDSDSGRILPQYRSGKEICHQEDAVRGRPETEAKEEEETNLRWPGHRSSSQGMGDL